MIIIIPQKMSKLTKVLLALTLLAGCNKPMQVSNKPTVKVVATTTIICDLTKAIAQNTIDLDCLIKPGTDPHIYQPSPSDRKAIEQANLILYSGYNFEQSLLKLFENKNNTVAVAQLAVPHPQNFIQDGKQIVDPHVFHNARNGAAMVKVIAQSLSLLSPTERTNYFQRANKLANYLLQIDHWIGLEISTIPTGKRKLVTTHDALGYYSKAYKIPLQGTLQGVNTEERPTAQHIEQLVKSIKSSQVPTIFAEVSINPKLLETVAKEANVKIWPQALYSDGLGEIGSNGDSYAKMLIFNTQNIVSGLGGKLIKPPRSNVSL